MNKNPIDVIRELVRDLTSFGNPFLLLFLFSAMAPGIKVLLAAIAVSILLELFCSMLKLALFRDRPKPQPYKTLLEKIDASSFPSIHTARATFISLAAIAALTTPFRFVLLALPLLVAYTRIALKKHRLTDTLAGLVIGLLAFLLYAYLLWGKLL